MCALASYGIGAAPNVAFGALEVTNGAERDGVISEKSLSFSAVLALFWLCLVGQKLVSAVKLFKLAPKA